MFCEGALARPVLEESLGGTALGTRSNHTAFPITEGRLRHCLVMASILAQFKAVGSQQGTFGPFKQDIVGEFNNESIYRGGGGLWELRRDAKPPGNRRKPSPLLDSRSKAKDLSLRRTDAEEELWLLVEKLSSYYYSVGKEPGNKYPDLIILFIF